MSKKKDLEITTNIEIMKTIAILTAICLIGVIWLLIKGTRDAKEIEDDNAGLTQDEIDAFMARAKDKHLSDLIDVWGRKKFGSKQNIH